MSHKPQERPFHNAILREWRCMLRGPFPDLVNLLTNLVKSRTGCGVAEHDVKDFLNYIYTQTPRVVSREYVEVPVNDHGRYAGKKVRSVSLAGEVVPLESSDWDEMVVAVCERIAAENPDDFPLVLDRIKGGKGRSYFARDPKPLNRWQVIGDTGIYVEKNLAANNAVSLCQVLSEQFGYWPDLEVEPW